MSTFASQQFHLFSAAPFGVSLPFLDVGPFMPLMRAQNDLRRLAFLEPDASPADGVPAAGSGSMTCGCGRRGRRTKALCCLTNVSHNDRLLIRGVRDPGKESLERLPLLVDGL